MDGTSGPADTSPEVHATMIYVPEGDAVLTAAARCDRLGR